MFKVPKAVTEFAGPVELTSALSVSVPKEESTYQAFAGDVITGFRMTKALTRLTDATRNSAVNSSVPRPTRLKERQGFQSVSGIILKVCCFVIFLDKEGI